jgi:hypothetical protein
LASIDDEVVAEIVDAAQHGENACEAEAFAIHLEDAATVLLQRCCCNGAVAMVLLQWCCCNGGWQRWMAALDESGQQRCAHAFALQDQAPSLNGKLLVISISLRSPSSG